MSFNFKSMTDEELNASDILVENGIYKFEVLKSTKKLSKSYNEMAELNIKFWDKGGNIHTLSDYLVFSGTTFCTSKIKHFCDSVGLRDNYIIGELPEELRGYQGYFEIGTQDEKENPKGGFYPKKNIVIDYVMYNNAESKNTTLTDNKGLTDFKNDDLPF